MDVVPLLTALAEDAGKPLGQLHALWTLEGLGQINLEAITGAMNSADPYVVESAIRLAALLPSDQAVTLLPKLGGLAQGSEMVVQRELAASLGRIP